MSPLVGGGPRSSRVSANSAASRVGASRPDRACAGPRSAAPACCLAGLRVSVLLFLPTRAPEETATPARAHPYVSVPNGALTAHGMPGRVRCCSMIRRCALLSRPRSPFLCVRRPSSTPLWPTDGISASLNRPARRPDSFDGVPVRDMRTPHSPVTKLAGSLPATGATWERSGCGLTKARSIEDERMFVGFEPVSGARSSNVRPILMGRAASSLPWSVVRHGSHVRSSHSA